MNSEDLLDYRKAYHSVLDTEREGGPRAEKETVLPSDRRWVKYIPKDETKKRKTTR